METDETKTKKLSDKHLLKEQNTWSGQKGVTASARATILTSYRGMCWKIEVFISYESVVMDVLLSEVMDSLSADWSDVVSCVTLVHTGLG